MADDVDSKSFMSPAQQRAYLSELRQQNAQLYGLTGAGRSLAHDLWARSSDLPPPGHDQEEIAIRSGGRPHTGSERPPIPPKTLQVRSLPKPPVRDTKAGPRPAEKPRALPTIPLVSDASAALSNLSMSEARATRAPPKLGPKPLPSPKVHSQSQSRHEETGRKVSLPIIHYEITQSTGPPLEISSISKRDSSESNRAPMPVISDNSRSVTIPVSSFPEHHSTYNREDRRPARHPEQDELVRPGVPSFCFTGPEPKDLFNQQPAVPTFSFSGPEDVCETLTEAAGNSQVKLKPSELPRRSRKRRAVIPEPQRGLVERGLNCANCYEALGRGRIITANNRRYHPSHFRCFECGIPLEHVDFYTHGSGEAEDEHSPEYEEVYCHFDYHELFTPRCHYCTTPVIRDGIKALGRVYHAEHFFCALCSQTFTDDAGEGTTFVEKDDMAWHPKCYEEKFSTSYLCRKCKKRIVAGGQVITMGTGSHFHPECFQCAHCKASLDQGFYWSKDKEGICKPCREIEVKAELT